MQLVIKLGMFVVGKIHIDGFRLNKTLHIIGNEMRLHFARVTHQGITQITNDGQPQCDSY